MREQAVLFDYRSVQQGAVAGILMAVFLGYLSVTGSYGTSPVKFLKYLVLLAIIGRSLYAIQSKVSRNEFLVASIKKGFVISLIGGIFVTVSNFLLFLIYPDYSIEKFNLSPETMSQLHLVNAALMVEILVIGLIGSFVLYQGLKYNR